MQERNTMNINKTQIEDTMRKANIAGVAIAYADNQGHVSHEEIGVKNNSTEDIHEDTVFACASLTKAVFAYLVLKLIDLKVIDPEKFNLECKLNTILPFNEFCEDPDIKLPPWRPTPADQKAVEKMTARMVLSHTTGLESPKDKPMQFQFKPGSEYGYSGIPFWYLQKVVEQLTNLSLEELGQRYIFNQSTEVFGESALKMPHSHFSGKYKEELVAANSLHTTAKEYARFMSAWVHDKSPVMQEAFIPAIYMTTDQWAAKGTGVSNNDLINVAWGLGIGLEIKNDKVIAAYHSGDMNEWRAWVAVNLADENNKTTIVYLANSPNGHMLADQIVAPNVALNHALNYFFQKYGFAREYTEDWQEKQAGNGDTITAFLRLRSDEVDKRNAIQQALTTSSLFPTPQSSDEKEKEEQTPKKVKKKPGFTSSD